MGNAGFISSTVGPVGVQCNCHHRQDLCKTFATWIAAVACGVVGGVVAAVAVFVGNLRAGVNELFVVCRNVAVAYVISY